MGGRCRCDMSERKNKYNTRVEPRLLEIAAWCRNGVIEADIAKNLGIAYSTFNEYKKRYSELSEVLKENKEVIDIQVENALLKTALGFEYTEETVTNAGEVVEVKKYSKPNTTSLIFWLKNRKPQSWRDRQEIEQTNRNITVNVGEWDDE